jgi:hypothetical protein
MRSCVGSNRERRNGAALRAERQSNLRSQLVITVDPSIEFAQPVQHYGEQRARTLPDKAIEHIQGRRDEPIASQNMAYGRGQLAHMRVIRGCGTRWNEARCRSSVRANGFRVEQACNESNQVPATTGPAAKSIKELPYTASAVTQLGQP